MILKRKNDNFFNQREQKLQISQKPIIGIDIGSSSVKIVQMKKNSILKRWGMDRIPEGVINQGRIEAPTALAEVVKRTIKRNRIKGSMCALCLSGSEVFVRELKLPEMNEKQIIENIKHEITGYLPLDLNEYCIDYRLLEYIHPQDGAPGKLRVMVVAVPANLVNRYIDTLKKAGLKVAYVDVVPNIVGKIAKWMLINGSTMENYKNTGIIDFGAHSTQVVILKDGNYFIYKSIANGGDYLTGVIADKGEMDSIEAEEQKLRTNFFKSDSQVELNRHVKNFFDYLLTDIERALEYFKNKNNNNGVEKIYLMGGGSLLKGLTEYMGTQLSASVSSMSDVLNPLSYNRDLGEKVAVFSHAIGATMREE